MCTGRACACDIGRAPYGVGLGSVNRAVCCGGLAPCICTGTGTMFGCAIGSIAVPAFGKRNGLFPSSQDWSMRLRDVCSSELTGIVSSSNCFGGVRRWSMPFCGCAVVDGLFRLDDLVVRAFPGGASAIVGGCSPGVATDFVVDDMAENSSRGKYAGNGMKRFASTTG